MSRSTNSKLLEGQVKDVIQSAKAKITDLKRDVTILEKERRETYQDLKDTEQRKEDLIFENNGLEEELQMLRSNNDQLSANKGALSLELKRAKEELASLIERTENQQIQLQKEISSLEVQEKKLVEIRRKEKKNFESIEQESQSKIIVLSETLNGKEKEIEKLKQMLDELSMKEDNRMELLEQESRNIKEILEKNDFDDYD